MELIEEKEQDYFSRFPGTRFMGSKNKIISQIWEILQELPFTTFFDAFGGSNIVGYYMKGKGKNVVSNDFMSISYYSSKAIIENSSTLLSKEDVEFLLKDRSGSTYIYNTFKDLYYSDDDNKTLDIIRHNIGFLNDEYKIALALASLVRACMKKRPRGIFTFTGHRYDDGRADIKKTLKDHFIHNVSVFNNAVFDNGTTSQAYNENTESIFVPCDLVYIDPPYFTPNSDNDYVRRYHFVEGLVKNWQGLELQEHTKTKKFKSYTSPFATRKNAYFAFENLITKYKDSIIVISYSSNSLPSKDEIVSMLKKHKGKVVVHEIDHRYSIGNQNHKIGNNANKVKEYLFIGQ